jgi:hypothetical protein
MTDARTPCCHILIDRQPVPPTDAKRVFRCHVCDRVIGWEMPPNQDDSNACDRGDA